MPPVYRLKATKKVVGEVIQVEDLNVGSVLLHHFVTSHIRG